MPTYLSTRFSRPMALLVALAMVAGLLVVTPSAGRAQSNTPMPDYVATFDACPEDVIPDADFSDVSSRHENVSDIDCIAYYGITRGVGNNRYAPDDPVIREHMALFLIRMAKLVGIDVPAPGGIAFRDIGHLSQESQDAITQLGQLGITIGVGNNNYAPGRNVSRGEMALFLARLMNQMDVPEHRGEVFGYLPADVEDRTLEDADVDTPYNDMRERTVAEYEAVEELYELGVASGISSRAYGPARDMSRSHMAEFMAAILDHSNLRPGGVTVQLTPTLGWESYTVTAMISARTSDFQPRDDERVDWFYTADPDGGLQANGECDLDLIIEGDCVWDDDRDDLTDDFGNYYETFNAEAGQVVTFYAWMGNRDGEEFDEDGAGGFGAAEARSDKGPEGFVIASNIPEHAATVAIEIGGSDTEGYVVDRDVQRSVRLTIQLRDEDGQTLDREGLEIEVRVAERTGEVNTIDVDTIDPDSEMVPTVTFPDPPTGTDEEDPISTDRRGEATFELTRPSGNNEGVSVVTFTNDEVGEDGTFAVIWSRDNPVVFSAVPTFDIYETRSPTTIAFRVEYDLYDQYGTRLNSRSSNVGRPSESQLKHTVRYDVYPVAKADGEIGVAVPSGDPEPMRIVNGRISYNLNTGDSDISSLVDDNKRFLEANDLFVLITPTIESATNGRVDATYAEPAVVWIVGEADNDADYDFGGYSGLNAALKEALVDLDDAIDEFTTVSVDTGRDEFRTFFTIWEYDSNDRLEDDDGTELTISQFENLLRGVTKPGDLRVRLYSPSSSGLSVFTVDR